jgi:hypothetical protein
MDPIKNPYTPGAGSQPPSLTGRDAQIASFKVLVERLRVGRSEKSLMVIGLRGVGKTVLLNKFRDMAESAGFRTGQTEITHETDFKATIARLARRIVLSLDLKEKVRDAAWRAAGVLKAFTVKTPEGYELGLNVEALRGKADSGIFSEDLADLFVALGDAAKERGSGAIFLLDEVQFLAKEDFEALISAAHQVMQKSLPLAVVGAGLPQLPKLAGEAKSYAERLFNFPLIGRLSPEDAKTAIEQPAREQGVSYDPAATLAIIKFTQGYPYFLQEYGTHVWNIATGPKITARDAAAAKANVLAQLDESFFRVRIDRATPAEKRYLAAMASLGPGPYKTSKIAGALGRSVTTVAPIRSRLIGKGHIYAPSHALTDFTVPMFDDYMRRNFPHAAKRLTAKSA